MASDAQPEYMGDLVQWMTNPDFCIEEVVLVNLAVVVLGDICKLTGTEMERATADNNIDGIALEGGTGDGTLQRIFLTRGPATVNHHFVNYQGLNEANCNATMLADLIIRVITGPTYTSQAT